MAIDTIMFKIKKDLKREFQIAVIKNGTDMTAVLLDAVKKYLGKK